MGGNERCGTSIAELIHTNAQRAPDLADSATAGEIIANLANAAIRIAHQRQQLATQIEELAAQHDYYPLLRTIPGMGLKTTSLVIAEIGDITQFPTGGHLASYAGLAPVNRQSGSGLNTVHKDRGGNHRLKNALFLAAFVATQHDPTATTHYQRLRERGKHHNAATIARRPQTLRHHPRHAHQPHHLQTKPNPPPETAKHRLTTRRGHPPPPPRLASPPSGIAGGYRTGPANAFGFPNGIKTLSAVWRSVNPTEHAAQVLV